MVGALYHKDDVRRDAGFSLFYAGINIGALIGGYACIAVGKNYSWNLAFGLAGIVMIISLITFVFTRRTLGPIGLPPGEGKIEREEIYQLDTVDAPPIPGDHAPLANMTELDEKPATKKPKWATIAVFIGSLAVIPVLMKMVAKTEYTDYFMYSIGPLALLYIIIEMLRYKKAVRKKLVAALIFIIFSIVFWAFFEQSGGSLSLFAAKNLDNKLLGTFTLDPNGVNNAANSLFVIIFAPIIGLVWLAMAKRKIEPNTVVKFGLGFLFLAGSFYIFYVTKFFANTDGVTSLDIFTLAYLVTTIGELCLSPIGLSIMTKLSPPKLQGVMMGMWFLASAYGQYAAGIIGAGISQGGENDSLMQKLITYTDGYKQLAIYALIAGVVLIAISPLVKKLMQEVR